MSSTTRPAPLVLAVLLSLVDCGGTSPGPAPVTTGSQDATAGDVVAGPVGGAVPLSGVYNARQTGGLVATGGVVRQNVLLRSGHLGSLDATGCQQFASLPVRTVIDLREAADATTTPDAPCVASSADYYLADLPKILPPSETSYLQTLAATEPKLAEIFNHLSKAEGLPALLHCVIGRDRSCIVTAIVLLAIGVPGERVIADFVSNQDPGVTVEAAWLQAVLTEIDKRGGIQAYLQGLGVPESQLTQLRAQALQ